MNVQPQNCAQLKMSVKSVVCNQWISCKAEAHALAMCSVRLAFLWPSFSAPHCAKRLHRCLRRDPPAAAAADDTAPPAVVIVAVAGGAGRPPASRCDHRESLFQRRRRLGVVQRGPCCSNFMHNSRLVFALENYYSIYLF